jgi:hypothetical protein
MATYPTHLFAGSSSERQSVGLPGHCERCAEVGHVAAHPSLGCGDVGCEKAHSPGHDVPPGSVWADNDERVMGRTLRVGRIEGDVAICVVLTNSNVTQAELDRGVRGVRDTRGRTTRISLRRFRPTSTGYRLVRAESHD